MSWIGKIDILDKKAYEYILIYADPQWLQSICHFLVKGNHLIPVLLLFFLYFAYKHKAKAALILLVSTLLLIGISDSTANVVKNYFGRHRPAYQTGIFISDGGFSLPSAHAVNTMAFAVFWAYRFKRAATCLYIFSIIIGLARMLANYHFPCDILAGWLIGYLVGYGFLSLYKSLEKNKTIQSWGTLT